MKDQQKSINPTYWYFEDDIKEILQQNLTEDESQTISIFAQTQILN